MLNKQTVVISIKTPLRSVFRLFLLSFNSLYMNRNKPYLQLLPVVKDRVCRIALKRQRMPAIRISVSVNMQQALRNKQTVVISIEKQVSLACFACLCLSFIAVIAYELQLRQSLFIVISNALIITMFYHLQALQILYFYYPSAILNTTFFRHILSSTTLINTTFFRQEIPVFFSLSYKEFPIFGTSLISFLQQIP